MSKSNHKKRRLKFVMAFFCQETLPEEKIEETTFCHGTYQRETMS
jgi:hypothetical protein